MEDQKELSLTSVLTPAELAFVKEYVLNLSNGVQAYQIIKPNTKYNVAKTMASRWLSKVDILEAIDHEYKKIWAEKDNEIEKSKTYQLISAIANSKISDVISIKNGKLSVKSLEDIPESALQAIQSIEYEEKETQYGIQRNIKVKMHPKVPALHLRAEVQKLINSKIEVPVNIKILPAIRPQQRQLEDK